MQPTLPSTNSIVDYLNSQKKDSSFSARTKLYKEAGLESRLGAFVGSASQNLNLLKKLQTPAPAAVAPTTPATNALQSLVPTTSAPVAPPVGNPLTSTLPQTSQPTATNVMSQIPPKTPSLAETIGQFSGPQSPLNPTPQAPASPAVPTPATPGGTYTGNSIVDFLSSKGAANDFESRSRIAERLGISGYRGSAEQNMKLLNTLRNDPNLINSQKADEATIAATGTAASVIQPDATPGEADVVNQWLNSPEGKLFVDKQNADDLTDTAVSAAAKAALEAKYEGDKAQLEQSLAANGLAFSGMRGTQVKALADSLASSLLKEDRALASKLLDQDFELRDAILKGVADIAKRAAEKDKEAIQQLNAIGYAVINGKLVPTLASRSADRADAQLEMSERRLQLAEESANRAAARFEQLYGAGKNSGFDYVRQLMELNPDATRAELKAAALENTDLNTGEIDAVLDTTGLTPNQNIEAAKRLVGAYFTPGFFSSRGGEVSAAQKKAKEAIRAAGALNVNGRTVTLTEQQIKDLEMTIDTVTADEAKASSELTKKK